MTEVIPSVAECFQLMDEYTMLENIKAHSIMVARVAEVISNGLIEKGMPLSFDLIIAAALLHDIAKTCCLNSEDDHSRKGQEICLALSFTGIGRIVGEHVVLRHGLPESGVTEREIVYYSDKRVNHDRIVSLDERLAYILNRYGKNDRKRYDAIMRNFGICKKLEAELFAMLDFEPFQLAESTEAFRAHSLVERNLPA